jgi:hypothetical protein
MRSLTWDCGPEGVRWDRVLSDPVVVRLGGQRPGCAATSEDLGVVRERWQPLRCDPMHWTESARRLSGFSLIPADGCLAGEQRDTHRAKVRKSPPRVDMFPDVSIVDGAQFHLQSVG